MRALRRLRCRPHLLQLPSTRETEMINQKSGIITKLQRSSPNTNWPPRVTVELWNLNESRCPSNQQSAVELAGTQQTIAWKKLDSRAENKTICRPKLEWKSEDKSLALVLQFFGQWILLFPTDYKLHEDRNSVHPFTDISPESSTVTYM